MSKAVVRLPTAGRMVSGITKTDAPNRAAPPVRLMFFCDRTGREYMDIQAIRDKNVLLPPEDYAGLYRTDVRALMFNLAPSCFIRIPFVVTNAAAFNDWTLRLQADDGVIIWLNGEEVLRYYVPDTVAWNSFSTTNRVGDREVVRVRPFVRVSSNLALSTSEISANIPPFNPQKIMLGDSDTPANDETKTAITRPADRAVTVRSL